MHFYIIFGTNLLTEGPVQFVVFAYFSVSQKRNIKRIPNGMKPPRGSFLEQMQSMRLGVDVKEAARKPRGREARPGGWARPLPLAFLVASLTYTLSLLDCFRSKNNFPEGFIPFGLRLIFLFCETPKQGEKQKLAPGSGLIG